MEMSTHFHEDEARVMTCTVEQCSYNCREECCAPMIQVREGHPECDTFTTAEVAVSAGEPMIESCGVADCHFNTEEMCHAAGVTLTSHAGHADCLTYRG